MISSRELALHILMDIEKNEAFSNILLNNKLLNSNLSSNDKRLTTQIVYGVIANKITLDHIIRKCSKIKFNKIFDSIFATNNIFDNYGDCYKLLGILLQISTPIEKEPHSGIKNAVIYIKENYSKNITIEKLAKLSHMSESNFYATFKKVFGNSPISYLNHYRLSIAAAKLNESDQSINEISSSVGITDPLYFSKLFKKTYGMSPKDYRRMYQTKT